MRVNELVPSLGDLGVRQVTMRSRQPVRRSHRDLDLGHHAEHADGDLGGVEQLAARLRHLDHLAGARDDAARRRVEENEPRRMPEPCVPVPIAPPICWVSMSPWLRSARPASHSGSPNAADARAGERRRTTTLGSTSTTPCRPASSSTTPSVWHDRREGVTGGGDAHAPARRDRVADRADDLALVARTQHGDAG